MYKVNINNVNYEVEEDLTLLEFLREHLGFTAAKNGCNQGVCGTCSVIGDGKVIRACTTKISKVVDKKITTLEGLTDREKDVYSYAFAKTGAVQCGFCIPGMIMAAKALIDGNNNPTRDDIKKAIRINICRCTGYVKIENAILLAAELIRDNKEVPKDVDSTKIGEALARVDAHGKALGTAKYVDDIVVSGMVFAKVIRPPSARCKVLSINKEKALGAEGAIAVYDSTDVPGNLYIGHLQKDWPVFIQVGEESRYVGDSIAMVVAEKKSQLEEMANLVEIEYEELEPLTDPFEAEKDGKYQIHGKGFQNFGNHFVPENNVLTYQKVKRGDVEKAFEEAAFISEHSYYTPPTEHAFMEPECAIGIPENDGVRVITSNQGIFDDYTEISEMLGFEPGNDKVRIQAAYVGGGFGGKEDMSIQHHAALAAFLSKKPVKILLSRDESILVHPKRHAMYMDFKVACDKDGKLLAMESDIVSDCGAYASLGGPVLQRACTHAAGPYNFQNVDIKGRAVYTNNPPGGAFRGFGVTQSCFGMECCLNDLAEKVGISGWEIRHRNAILPGQVLPNGQIADDGTAFLETVEACKDFYDEYTAKDGYYVGIASSMKNAGVGVGLFDIGRCNLYVKDEKVHIRTSAAAIGQGLQTIMVQIASVATGLKPSQFIMEQPDTKYTPDSGTTTASRQTVFTGEATKRASELLKEALKNKTLKELDGEIFKGEFDFKTDAIGSDKPNPVSHVAYGYNTQVVVIDEDGKVVITKQASDVGKAINPITVEGQIEGGTIMSMGFALTEDFPLKDGVPQVKYGTLGLLRAPDCPPIISTIIEKNKADIAYSAKGVGEIAAIPFAPAVQNAYFKKDNVFRTKLPLEDTAYKKVKKK